MGSNSGSAPAVVFESGIGATSQNWLRLQRTVAHETRTISYDRAGLGWSNAAAESPTPEALARDLRHLLAAAEIPGPYVVVGHSFGGLVARQFAVAYPGLVTGLVLVDPMRPRDWPPLNESGKSALHRAITLSKAGIFAARIGAARLFMRSVLLGSRRIARLLCRLGGEPAQTLMDRMLCELGKMPHEARPSVVANWSRPEFYQILQSYLRAIPATVTSMHSAPPVEVPVMVLTPFSTAPLDESQLRAISSEARQVIAPASAHWIHLDEPELVLSAIREMLTVAARTPSSASMQEQPPVR
jgi:pimeloyl-ACP methyl ester carboxylesterase